MGQCVYEVSIYLTVAVEEQSLVLELRFPALKMQQMLDVLFTRMSSCSCDMSSDLLKQ